jgi:ABC-type uncharacterized transport system involved in gliding motility auxiliary subunit
MKRSTARQRLRTPRQRLAFRLAIGAVLVFYIGLISLNQHLGSRWRLDLTQQNLFTLSSATLDLLSSLDEPIQLTLYFSYQASQSQPQLRQYATRVRTMVNEFALYANAELQFEFIDPKTISQQELAQRYGLNAYYPQDGGAAIFFGLVGVNRVDGYQVVEFFDPSGEALLEFQLASMLYRLNNLQQSKLVIIEPELSDFSVAEPTTDLNDVIEALARQLQVERITSQDAYLPEDSQVVVLINPENYSRQLLYAIEQFALAGNSLIIFVDPLSADGQIGDYMEEKQASPFELLHSWGVSIDLENIVLDPVNALTVADERSQTVEHFAYIGSSVNRQNLLTKHLNQVNGATWGELIALPERTTRFSPLLFSSDYGVAVNKKRYQQQLSQGGVAALFGLLDSPARQRVLAASITGKAGSIFNHSKYATEQHIKSTDALNVVVFTDSDLLQKVFYGDALASHGDNLNLLMNIIDSAVGSESLVAIRGRQQYNRPFIKIAAMRYQAQQQYNKRQRQVNLRLAQTDESIRSIKASSQETLVLLPQQEMLLKEYQSEQKLLLNQLADLKASQYRHENALLQKLKMFNILVMPLLFLVVISVLHYLFKWHHARRFRQLLAAREADDEN